MGTVCLDAVHYLKYRRAGGSSGPLAWEFAPIESWEQAPDPGQVAKRVIEGFTQRKLPDRWAFPVSTVVHWGYGSAAGAAYGIVAGSLGRPTPCTACRSAPPSSRGTSCCRRRAVQADLGVRREDPGLGSGRAPGYGTGTGPRSGCWPPSGRRAAQIFLSFSERTGHRAGPLRLPKEAEMITSGRACRGAGPAAPPRAAVPGQERTTAALRPRRGRDPRRAVRGLPHGHRAGRRAGRAPVPVRARGRGRVAAAGRTVRARAGGGQLGCAVGPGAGAGGVAAGGRSRTLRCAHRRDRSGHRRRGGRGHRNGLG